jgi:predicted transcriptional regulator
LREAAHLMSEEVISVPAADHDHLVRMATNQDINIRGVALGKGPGAKVKEVMSEQVNTASKTRTSTTCPRIWPRSKCGVC